MFVKKLAALMLAASLMTIGAASCSKDNNDKKETPDDSCSEKSERDENDDSDNADSPDKNAIGDSPATVEEGLVDSALVGTWYSETMGGSFCFDEDNTVSLMVNYSEIMHFQPDTGQFYMYNPGDTLTEADGGKITVTYVENDDMSGLDESVFMVLESESEISDNALDGEYTLVGGDLFDDMNETLFDGEAGSRLSMIIDGESLWLKMEICRYTADGERLEMYGEGAEMFSITTQEEAVCEYTVEGDKFTMTDASGESMEYVKK